MVHSLKQKFDTDNVTENGGESIKSKKLFIYTNVGRLDSVSPDCAACDILTRVYYTGLGSRAF
jgi:hypothetical protein